MDMKMDVADPATTYYPPDIMLDSRFAENLGGNGSNMVSRSKYELISAVGEKDPTLTLEVYAKFNADIPD